MYAFLATHRDVYVYWVHVHVGVYTRDITRAILILMELNLCKYHDELLGSHTFLPLIYSYSHEVFLLPTKRIPIRIAFQKNSSLKTPGIDMYEYIYMYICIRIYRLEAVNINLQEPYRFTH